MTPPQTTPPPPFPKPVPASSDTDKKTETFLENTPDILDETCPENEADTVTATDQSFTVLPQYRGTRLDKFLAEQLKEDLSRQKIKGLIENGGVSVSGRTVTVAKTPLAAGATVTITLPVVASSLVPEEGDLAILFRNENLVLLDKPAGLTVHPCPSCPEGTLAHRLVAHFPEIAAQEGFRPGIVHRLDKDTSGLMLAALTTASQRALAELFARHEVEKTYLALISGVPASQEGRIDMPVGRHPTYKTKMAAYPKGKPALSYWKVLEKDPDERFSLVAVRIETGRTHQIRVHMAHLGHPLLGDSLYRVQGKSLTPDPASRQMLHAWKLALPAHTAGCDTMCANGHDAKCDTGRDTGRDAMCATERATDSGMNSAGKNTGDSAVTPPSGSSLRASVSVQNGQLCATCPPPPDFADTLLALGLRPLRAIVTGMPGCGKSSLLACFADNGCPTFSADACVGQLYAPDGDGATLLSRRFGERFMLAGVKEKAVDKAALGRAMMTDDALRREVESLIHPLVFHALEQFWHDNAQHPLAVAEVPLYFESGRVDKEIVVVGVHTPFAVRKERLQANRDWHEDTIAAMESWQMPEEAKMTACTVVVENVATAATLACSATALHAELLDIRRQRACGFAQAFARHYSV